MKTNKEKKEFYERCGTILGIIHEWVEPVPRRTRWNTRLLGNGRFKGFGIIRCHGSGVVVMSRQRGTHTFNSYADVYIFLEGYMDDNA